MKNLFEAITLEEVIRRIESVRADASHQWGKMDVAQMMAHCSLTLDMACGDFAAKQILLGRILGPRLRHMLTNEKTMPRNSPTAKELRVGSCDFDREHQRLLERVRQFHQGGESRCTKHPHLFFGPISPTEWGTGRYKHLDHHLRQFGA